MARILIIEDDSVLGGAITQRLRLEGFNVRWVKSCKEALLALRQTVQDFILADIRLPDGSGEELYCRAMPLLGDTPIVSRCDRRPASARCISRTARPSSA